MSACYTHADPPMRRFRARGNGLELSVVQWDAIEPRATCLMIHGFQDAAGSFDLVAPKLAAAGVSVVAPDMRGFGESDRVSGGGYYHFPDYVADVDALIRAIVPEDEKLFVVGHSMGGTIATLVAGARPSRVAKLAVLEGVGPLETPESAAPLRMLKWLEDLVAVAPNAPMTEEDALARLSTVHARVPREVLASRLPHLATKRDDGALVWRFDPLHRTTSPMPFVAKSFGAFAARVTCPVLYVSGGPLGWRVPDEEERVAAFPNATRVDFPDAGHMMHWTAPDALAKALIEFFKT